MTTWLIRMQYSQRNIIGGENTIINWIKSNKLDTIVVIGVMLDWLPQYILSGSELSGTKLLCIPFIAIDMILNTRAYVKKISYVITVIITS